MYAPLPQKGMETGMKKFRIWILAALAAALCLLCGCSAEDFALPHEVQLAVGQQCALAGELRFTGSLSDITPQDRAEFAQAVTDAVVHIASTDPSVAAVDQDGNVTAVTPGTATVLVSCVDLDFYAEVNINVVEAATPESAALATPETAAQSTPETATPESAEPATPETASALDHASGAGRRGRPLRPGLSETAKPAFADRRHCPPVHHGAWADLRHLYRRDRPVGAVDGEPDHRGRDRISGLAWLWCAVSVHSGRPAALAAGTVAGACGALGLFHRLGAGGGRSGGHDLVAPPHVFGFFHHPVGHLAPGGTAALSCVQLAFLPCFLFSFFF